MTSIQQEPGELASQLARFPPFDALDAKVLAGIAEATTVVHYRPGELILDAFVHRATELYVVLAGQVNVWNDTEGVGLTPDETVLAGGMFGYSTMLTERSIGPRAVAMNDVTIAKIPAAQATQAFASTQGARFLVLSYTGRLRLSLPALGLVDDLVHRPPLVVAAHDTAAEIARRITDEHRVCAVVTLPGGGHRLVTDASLRQRVVAEGLPGTAPATEVLAPEVPSAALGESAGEVLIRMLDADADAVVITDRTQQLHGVVTLRDFALSPTTADRLLREQLRSAADTASLIEHARQVPALIDELHARGLSAGLSIAVFSAFLDVAIRRAIELVFAAHPELSVDDFTWLSLGSNGRREAVLSSDIDSAAAFVDGTSPEVIGRSRAAFAEINQVLGQAGLAADHHGTSASQATFARTNAEWRAAARVWMDAPEKNNGAIMTSLLVDGRPIYGDPGLAAVTLVFSELRGHPGTLRLLLQDTLARRAKLGSTRDSLLRRVAPFNLKKDAMLPVVNLARWAALSVGSSVLPTVERLRAAAGSSMLPDDQATTLIEVFEALQRLRLRRQLMQYRQGQTVSDQLTVGELSPMDRSMVGQAVREITAIQRRMTNVAMYVAADEWAQPEPS